MPLSEARKRANAKYNAKAYEQLNIRLKTGERTSLQNYVDKSNMSLNNFVTSCIAYCIDNNINLSNTPALGNVLPKIQQEQESE